MGRYLEGNNLIPSWLVPPPGCQAVHILKDPFLQRAVLEAVLLALSLLSPPSTLSCFLHGPGALFLTCGSSHSYGCETVAMSETLISGFATLLHPTWHTLPPQCGPASCRWPSPGGRQLCVPCSAQPGTAQTTENLI